jgi:molecular chaperone DnaJ
MAYELYSLLGVDQNASADEIKKAYRKKAMELHPDRHKGDKTKEAEFKKINEAYSVLSDPQKKAGYDRFGTTDGPGGGGFWWFQWGFGQEFDVGDIFSSFFWGGFDGGFWGGGRRKKEVGGDIEIRVDISFKESYLGVKKEVSFIKKILCSDCHGTGAAHWKDGLSTCPDCSGSGKVKRRMQTMFGVVEQVAACERCNGTGQVIKEVCSTCKGKKTVQKQHSRTIDIPAGIDNEMSIKLRDEGHEWKDGSGDLYVQFQVPESSENFIREESDLIYVLDLDPVECVLGTKKQLVLDFLPSREVDIKPGTESGTELVFRWEGFPSISQRWTPKGDFIVRFHLVIPKKLTKKERELYEALANEKKLDTYNSKGFFEKLFD